MKFSAKPVLLSAALALAACAAPSAAHSDKEATVSPPTRTRSVQSRYGFAETVSRLQQAVKAKGMTVFAVIDHQAAARGRRDWTLAAGHGDCVRRAQGRHAG